MAKDNSNLINMSVTLFLITAISAVVLASVYSLTKEPIAQAKAQKLETAVQNVMPEFDRLEQKEIPAFDMPKKTLLLNIAYKGDEIVGYAINSYTNKGFSGDINVMVGLLTDGTINDTYVLEHKETPGLGTKMSDDKFRNQFKGLDPTTKKLYVKKDGGDVDAITAATISSRAFCDALNRAIETLKTTEGKKNE
ncbi:MAG: RnfABCDGE type electron transport complex subunit G [Bacteroidales bacterium]|nr:RnfABCDGE type electron transport complex subunit G [Bacteroidales bacterium]MDY0216126.1 RnfABCDGE type electron transport complex subunit G [Bacteroidales bacterium]